jgi:hypothetical protein
MPEDVIDLSEFCITAHSGIVPSYNPRTKIFTDEHGKRPVALGDQCKFLIRPGCTITYRAPSQVLALGTILMIIRSLIAQYFNSGDIWRYGITGLRCGNGECEVIMTPRFKLIEIDEKGNRLVELA